MQRARIKHWAALGVITTSALGGVFACSGDDENPAVPDAGVDGTVPKPLPTVDGSSGSDGRVEAPPDAGTPDATPDAKPDAKPDPLGCEVAIVGGGPGGLHTAYKLTNPPDGGAVPGVTSGSGVCLFEKNDRLGGRIRDVSFGPNANDVTGTGAYRMYDNQYTFELATELGVPTVAPISISNLRALQDPGGTAGQRFGYSGDAFKALYAQALNDDDMAIQLMCGPQVPKDASNRPNYAGIDGGIAAKSTVGYVTDVLGANGAKFFFDLNRFRADFTNDVDAVGYMEYLNIEWFGAGATVYPIPGHSAAIAKMKAAIEAKGGRIFLSEPVTSIASATDGSFTLETGAHTVTAKQVVLAVPHGAVARLTGDVISSITSAKEYQNVTSAKSMQVTHQWNRAWWQGDLRYPDAGSVVGGDLPDGSAPIRRADTTIKPNGYCINSIEMPFTAHHDALKVTRTVYSDDRACVDKNLMLYGDGGAAGADALDAELKKSLRILFPAVFDGTANEPQIVKGDVNVHEEAWYYLKTGATTKGVTNKSLFDWSVTPVTGKKIYLVGDPWYPLGSGWANAAYISSIRVLNTHFGMSIPSRELQPAPCP